VFTGTLSLLQNEISIRYPVVEAATGILFLLFFWVFGVSIQTLGYWTFAAG
jgi:leader peptidase (prepilin peptidase)/N-methyltransferase